VDPVVEREITMTAFVDTVKTALKSEVQSELFFRRAAELTSRDDSRIMFMELADLEERHVHDMAERVSGTRAGQGFDAPGYVTGLEATLGVIVSDDEAYAVRSGDVRTVIRLAKGREADMRDSLLFMAREVEDTSSKSLYTALSQLEDEHLDELKRLELSIDMPDAERPAL